MNFSISWPSALQPSLREVIGSPGITEKQHSSQTTQGMQKVHQNTPNYRIQKYFAKIKPSLSKAVTKPLSSPGTPTQLWGHGEILELLQKPTSKGWHLLRVWSKGCPGVGVALTALPGVSPVHNQPEPTHDGTATCPAVGQRHNTQHSSILVLGSHQKGGVFSNENWDFLQATWMSQPVTSLGIPKICTVKKSQPQIGLISCFPLTE